MNPRDPDVPVKATASAASFGTTRWSVVARAAQFDPAAGAQALEDLCRTYWPPVYGFLRRRGHTPHQAEDLTQGFFEKLLANNYVRDADRDKGKFRTFLLTAVTGYAANEWDRSQSQKRGGGLQFVSLQSGEAEDRLPTEPSSALTPEKIFDRRWAETLLDQVMKRLRQEYSAAGFGERFDVLKVFLVDAKGTLPFSDAAVRLGLSESAVKSFVHRLRHRYREVFRIEIAETVSSPDQIDDEIRHLLVALAD